MATTNRQMMNQCGISLQQDMVDAVCVPNSSSMTRGACPSLSAPMTTGDGLLVRLRPTTPGLTIPQFRALAQAARQHGNGLIEITARGNLQLRGMSTDSMAGLAADIDRVAIVPESGIAIETPPLSGIDPTEIADARDFATRLRQEIATLDPQPVLAPKLTIIVDAGGLLNLDGLVADIRLKAVKSVDGSLAWAIAIAGTSASAQPLATLTAEQARAATIDLLKALTHLGPQARARHLDLAGLRPAFQSLSINAQAIAKQRVSPVGIHRLGAARIILGLRPAFGQIHAADLIPFLDAAEAAGASEIRTAPEHAILVIGLQADAAKDVELAAANCGFRIRADDPTNHIDVCSGAGACGSAHYATKSVAADLPDIAPDLFDGSLVLHLSGCRKGCARPGKATLVIVGAPTGYEIVVNGSASQQPVAYIGKEALKPALARVSSLVRENKVAGESAEECLTRLGTDAIAAALRQG